MKSSRGQTPLATGILCRGGAALLQKTTLHGTRRSQDVMRTRVLLLLHLT